MTIAVFALNGIGDHVMMWPALRALHRVAQGRIILFSDTRITDQLYADLRPFPSVHIPWTELGGVRHFDPELFLPHLKDADCMVCLNSWFSPSVTALLSRIPGMRTLGFFQEFTQPVCGEGLNAFDAYFRIAQFAGYTDDILSCAQPPPYEPLNRSLRQKLLVLHPETDPAKDWNESSISAFLDALQIARPTWSVALVHLFAERYQALKARHELISLCCAPFEDVTAWIAAADIFVGCDSSLLHLADLLRTPSVALFRSSCVSTWGCRFTAHRYVYLDRDSGAVGPAAILEAIAELQLPPHLPAKRERTRA